MQPDEQLTGSKGKGWPVASLALFVSLIASILYSVPQFMRIYEELWPGEPLPTLTRSFFAVSPVAYIGIMAAGVVLILFMYSATRSPRSCRGIDDTVAWLSVIAFVVYEIALYLPFTGMHQGLRG